MKNTTRGVFLQILLTISLSKCESAYTSDELEVTKNLGTSLGIKHFTFVQNHKFEFAREIMTFPKTQLFSCVINPERLYEITNGKERRWFFSKQTVLVTKEKINFTRFLKRLSDIRSATWLVFVKSPEDMKNFYIPINTNFFICHNEKGTIVINKVFHIKPGLEFLLESSGTWSKEKKNNIFPITNKRKINFRNNTLDMLYFYTTKECNNGRLMDVLGKIECFHQNIINLSAERLNFKLNKLECQDRKNPYNLPNGTPSEMFTALSRNLVDFSSGSYVVNNHRLTNFDFAWPAFTTTSMMYLRFTSTKSSWRAYLRPMESRIWKAIVAWVVTTGFLVKIFEILRTGNFHFKLSLIPELIQSVLISLQIICNQGVHDISRWYSTRLIFLLTFFLFVTLYQVYSGFLISSLTVVVPDLPFADINEFFRDGTYKIMMLKSGFHHYHVKNIFKERRKSVKDFILDEAELPRLTEEGIKKLCSQRNLVFVEYRENMAQYEIPCRILELHKPLLYQNMGLGFPKNSPYRDIINQQLNLLRTSGILQRMREHLLSYTELTQKETSYTGYIKVSLRHVVSIIFSLGIGLVISIMIFLTEVLSHFLAGRVKDKRKRIKKNDTKRCTNNMAEPNKANKIQQSLLYQYKK